MTDDHGIVPVWGELAPRAEGDGDIAQDCAGFEGEGGDDGDGLVEDEL